ncbi:IS110 family RNA-guided transposase [Rhizorhabdus wittichii]|nr:IS110 family transposase [Rhizorhabdus wittichii]
MAMKVEPADVIRHEALFSVGLDVSQRSTSICVVDEQGQVVLEGQAKTDPFEIGRYLQKRLDGPLKLGMETGSLAAWLYHGLRKMGFDVVCMDAVHAHRALSLKRHKTDRNDARGLAELLRMGSDWMNIVHVREQASQELRVQLAARGRLVKQRVDLENELCGLLKPFGFVVARGNVGAETFRDRVVDALTHAQDIGIQIKALLLPLLDVHRVLARHITDADARLEAIAATEPICRKLMTIPGVGPVTALAFRAAVDDPSRFKTAADVGVYFGLTPRRQQSGEKDRHGRISKRGDVGMRLHLVQAATVLLVSVKRWSTLKAWGVRLVNRIGFNKAKVAVARKLATVMYRIWRDQSVFRWGKATMEPAAPAAATS